MKDSDFIKIAIQNAQKSIKRGGFPAGAVIAKNGKVISDGLSLGSTKNDPTSHGEIDAIRKACKKIGSSNLSGAILYTSMESCLMCFSAASWANISEVVFASRKEKFPKDFYEGKNRLKDINSKNNVRIKLRFFPGFEDEVLGIVNEFLKK